MSFIIRSVAMEDTNQLLDLAKQFTLLNLPGDKKVVSHKIEKSLSSFAHDLPKEEAEYLFVLEDTEENAIVGSSLIMAKHGNENIPHNFFKIIKRDHYSDDLGIGFIHQVLQFQLDTDGPTEIGGLLIDKAYRRRPEKLGKQMSLSRFLYIAMQRENFEDRVLCELTPPLTDDRSEFWEALGRRFTGLPYQEADMLSQSHKEFISSLFPTGEIYLCLLDAKARTVLGRVGEQTKPAQHLLESIGFKYLNEVDPFDGGPHFGCDTDKILPIKHGKHLKLGEFKDASFKEQGLLGLIQDNAFKGTLVNADIRNDEICIPEKQKRILEIEGGEKLFWAPFNYKTPTRGEKI